MNMKERNEKDNEIFDHYGGESNCLRPANRVPFRTAGLVLG